MNPGAQYHTGKIRKVWALTAWLRWTDDKVKAEYGERKLEAYTSEGL